MESLISIIENKSHESIRIKSIKLLGAINGECMEIFNILENLVVSDENSNVRGASAEIFIDKFMEKGIDVLKWVIQNDKSNIVLKILINKIESIDSNLSNILKNEIIERFAGHFSIVHEEAIFFKDLFLNMMDIDENFNLFGYEVKKYRLRDHLPIPFIGWFINRIASVRSGHVIDLDLTRMGLSYNDIPESIKLITQLKHLRLNANNLKNLPKSISLLKSLQSLKLMINKFTKFPKPILFLHNLKYLSLENNALKKLPRSIDSLHTLKRLKILHNNIKKIPNSLLRLTERNLAKKYILRGVVPEEAGVLGLLELLSGLKLQKIAIDKEASDYNDIVDFMHNYKLNKSGHITEIWLYAREPLLGIFPEQICRLKYLEELHLCDHYIKFIPKQIGKLKSLRVLNLLSNMISKLPRSMKKMKNLRELYLYGNNIKHPNNKNKKKFSIILKKFF